MKANELRIGNLMIDLKSGAILRVIELTEENNISFYVIDRSLFPLEKGWKAEPIPLTEEWLLKLGFENMTYSWILFLDDECFELSLDYKFKTDCGHSYKNKIEYVHQLQNLYFALIGEELKLIEK